MFASFIISRSAICVWKALQMGYNVKVFKFILKTKYKVALVKISF